MSDHTPGPWSARLNPMKLQYDIDAAGWRTCARVYLNEDPDLSRQGHANARLIAAAPDLLEACEAIRSLLRDNPHIRIESDHPAFEVAFGGATAAIDAAIAKARGEAVPA